MKQSGTLANWLSIAANIGIVAGLVLVAVQINQESDIAGTTLESELFAYRVDYHELVVGEDTAASLARAIYDPASLTDRDKVVLETSLRIRTYQNPTARSPIAA